MPYIGHSPTQAGSYIEVDDFGSSFNGNDVAFTLQVGGVNITPNQQNLLVMIDGVLQQPTDAFSVSGSTITFTEAPDSGADLYCLLMGQSASVGQGTIGADELKISGDGTSGQLLKSDGDGTYSYLNQTSVTAGTATTLATARTINGVSFDGSANITVTADANTLSNTTLKSTVVNSSLTSVGTLSSLAVTGNITTDGIFKVDSAPDNDVIQFDQGGRKSAIKTYFSSNSTGSKLILKVSDGNTNGGMVDALDVRPAEATFAGTVTANGSDYILKGVSSSTTDGHAARVSAETGASQGKIEIDFFNDSSRSGGGYGLIQVGKTSNAPKLGILASACGVGTNNPSAKLHVAGGAGNDVEFHLGDADGDRAELIYRNDCDFEIRQTCSTGAIQIINEANRQIEFHTNNTNRMTVKNDGNVDFTGNLTTTGSNITVDPPSGDASLLLSHSSQTLRIDQNSIRTTTNSAINIFTNNTNTQGIYISNSGNVSIGTTSSGGNSALTLAASSYTNGIKYFASNGQASASFEVGGSVVGSITHTTSATAFNESSDYRLKENEVPISDALTRLNQLKPYRFNFIVEPDITVDGFFAHEVAEVVPEAVTGEKDAVDDEDNIISQGIDKSKLVPLLVKAVQELSAKVEALENA